MDLSPNSTLPIMWGIFIVVFVFLNQFVFKPTLEIIEKRRHQGEGLAEQSKALAEDNQKKISLYESQILAARTVAGQARETILKAAREEERALIETARKAGEAKLKELRSEIEGQKNQAAAAIKNDVAMLSGKMFDRIVSGS